MSRSLFGDVLEFDPAPAVQPDATGPFAGVALERSLDKVLTYAVPPAMATLAAVGQRVAVPLGRGDKRAYGWIVSLGTAPASTARIKPIAAIDDARVLVPPRLMDLARWMSRYYICPLGTVLESVIPSAVKKRIGLGYRLIARSAVPRQRLAELATTAKSAKRRALLGRLLLLADNEPIPLDALATDADTTPATARKLAKAGLITLTPEPDLATIDEVSESGTEPDRDLNPDQSAAMDRLVPRLDGGFSVSLLLGVTGSGKTEVYLQCIRRVIAAGRRAIVLVPEIALTPQTVRRFTARFPRVAVLHSGLSGARRHRQWQMILSGRADVVVGARSAIFAPLPDIGVIVVDEEHESSYKQDSAPRYNARDLAIKRGQLESVPVILGSATPSLETYFRAGDDVIRLPRRVRGLALPDVELVDMKGEAKARRAIGSSAVSLLSLRLERLLTETLAARQQAILLLNRRGYSNFVYCVSCQTATRCDYCDATLTYHRTPGTTPGHVPPTAEAAAGVGRLHCHYCLATSPLPTTCPVCEKKMTLFGLGTQRVEEELAAKFPGITYARVDSDTMRNTADYEAVLRRFAAGELQVLLGTQMIAKGLDYPNVTLVGVISGDTALSLPDFRASERTFQLITQVAGRAGRGDSPGRVVVQTFLPDDPTLAFALHHDFDGFARAELPLRHQTFKPPYARLARIVLRDHDESRLHELADSVGTAVKQAAALEPAVRILGPMPCAIGRIAGYHRQNILLSAPGPAPLQRVLASLRGAGSLSRTDRIAIDVDPVSLL